MTIKEMHYDFKKKLNKVDSQQHKNFLIPEIDWVLNEAQEIFVKSLAKPRKKSYAGFETSQRITDDIRNIVVQDIPIKVKDNIASLPKDYWHYIIADVYMNKGICKDVKGQLYIRQHDDLFENSPFDNSSFEWRTVNATFVDNSLRLYTDGSFVNSKIHLTYLKKLKFIHNAEDFREEGYKLPSGIILEGSENCELADHTHREIVDIAVLIATGEIQSSDYQIKMTKIALNEIK